MVTMVIQRISNELFYINAFVRLRLLWWFLPCSGVLRRIAINETEEGEYSFESKNRSYGKADGICSAASEIKKRAGSTITWQYCIGPEGGQNFLMLAILHYANVAYTRPNALWRHQPHSVVRRCIPWQTLLVWAQMEHRGHLIGIRKLTFSEGSEI